MSLAVNLCINCSFLVERPALAVRLDLCFRSVYFYFFYPGISSERLNLSQPNFARWRQMVRNRKWWFEFLNFWGGLGWGPKMSLFARICPEWPSQNTILRQNGERYQKSKTVLFWPDNGENRAKIRKGTAEILWRIYKKFTFLPAIFRLSSTLKLYNFYTVQGRGIQSAYEMLRMKRAF